MTRRAQSETRFPEKMNLLSFIASSLLKNAVLELRPNQPNR
jgi:hypothetical protein